MEEIKNTVASVIGKWQAKLSAAEGGNPEGWLKNSLTKKELRHIKIDYFRMGVLGLSVDSSVWMYTLGLKKQALLSSLSLVSGNKIKGLRLRLGETK